MSDYNIRFSNTLPRELIRVGYNLELIGLNEMAWKKNDVIKVIDFLTSKGYAILGGDVYLISGDGVESTYDSWYINKSANQSFLEETRKRAFEYISQYSENNVGEYLYSIVFEIV